MDEFRCIVLLSLLYWSKTLALRMVSAHRAEVSLALGLDTYQPIEHVPYTADETSPTERAARCHFCSLNVKNI